jgi:hypothetical protein
MGLYMIGGRFFVDAWQRSKTYYGLTSERVIIVSGLFSRKVQSLRLRSLSDISFVEGKHGVGTITFGPAAPWGPGTRAWPGTMRTLTPSFESIPGARTVFDQIRGIQQVA